MTRPQATVPPVDQHADNATAARDQLVLGGALRELRRQAGLTQEQVGDRLGTDATFVSRIERGKRGVRWHTLQRFLRVLDADLHQLADAVTKADRQAHR